MAHVLQLIATDSSHEGFNSNLVDGAWHAHITAGDDPRTVCGVVINGEEGISSGEEKEGRVTCQTCRSILADIQAIKNWK